MSFWKALEHDLTVVGKDALALAPVAGAVVGVVNPAAGMLITGVGGRLTASIASVEQTITDAKAGALKAATVKADLDNALALAQDVTGETFTYDGTALQTFIDAQVAAFNAEAAFKGTLKKA